MEDKVVFVGPSCVGKGFVSTYVSEALKLHRVDLDLVLLKESAYSKEDVLDCIQSKIHDCDVLDIGGNTIYDFEKEDVKQLKFIVGQKAKFFYLRPSPNHVYSFRALLKQSGRLLKYMRYGLSEEDLLLNSILCDLSSPTYRMLATNTIYTFKNSNGSYVTRPTSLSRNEYQKRLVKVSQSVIQNICPEAVFDKTEVLEQTKIQRQQFFKEHHR